MTEATRGPETNKVDALWERFKASGDADARERLILNYSTVGEIRRGPSWRRTAPFCRSERSGQLRPIWVDRRDRQVSI